MNSAVMLEVIPLYGVYTVSQKGHFVFAYSFGVWQPIFTILADVYYKKLQKEDISLTHLAQFV